MHGDDSNRMARVMLAEKGKCCDTCRNYKVVLNETDSPQPMFCFLTMKETAKTATCDAWGSKRLGTWWQ